MVVGLPPRPWGLDDRGRFVTHPLGTDHGPRKRGKAFSKTWRQGGCQARSYLLALNPVQLFAPLPRNSRNLHHPPWLASSPPPYKAIQVMR